MAIDTDSRGPRLLVVDPHPVTRLGIKTLLQQADRKNTLLERSTVDEVLTLSEPPHLVILDSDGRAEPIEALRHHWRAVPIVVFSGRGDLMSVHRAFSSGATAYVLKSSTGQVLRRAVTESLGNHRYSDPALGPLESVVPSDPVKSSQPAPSCLSEREDQVLRLIALGLTNREIAERLELSVKTVETYRARTLEKLGLRSRADLVDYAIREGMLAFPQALAG